MSFDFSLRRLQLLIRKQWMENNRFYGLAAITLAILIGLTLVLAWVMPGHDVYHESELVLIYMVGLFLIGTLYTNAAFQNLGNKEKGQYLLSLPATHGEKLTTAILYTTVFFPLVYTFLFWIIRTLAVRYVLWKGGSFNHFDWSDHNDPVFYTLLLYIAIQSLFLLGSVYFKRYAFVKTVIVVTAVGFLYVYFMVKMGRAIIPEGLHWEGNRIVRNDIAGDPSIYHEYRMDKWLENTLLFLGKYMWAPFFWLVTWVRLKEKQI